MKTLTIERAWFSHDGAEFEHRLLTASEVEDVKAKTEESKIELQNVDDLVIPVRTFRNNKRFEDRLILLKSITGWGGETTGPDGKQLDYSEDNKAILFGGLLHDEYRAFLDVFKSEQEKLRKIIEEQREAARKNS